VATLHLARDAPVHAENVACDDAREGKMAEDVVEHLEQLLSPRLVQEALLDLGKEAVGLVDRAALVVPAEKRELTGVDELEQEQQHDDLERLTAA
ncbi:hypothetical protein PMAYCL1PPCAC_22553, partial [Pristionchus mayeri]